MSLGESRFLSKLNEAQKEAVLACDGPLLILAGAGSGKTRVITVKLAYLISELGYDPYSILALTFTNKAAGEMRHRAAELDPRANEVLIKTFHSFGAWMLRRNPEPAGVDANFSIYDDDDTVQVLALLYPDRPKNLLSTYATAISRAKDRGYNPDSLELIGADLPDLAEVYARYAEKIQAMGNVDFGDLILKPRDLLLHDEAIRRRFHQRFKVILVDEYQDSNLAQYQLLSALYSSGAHLCVVGDDDQSIYRFRGAEVRNILEFPNTFPGTKVVRLEENYRSTNRILELAGSVVAHNEGRLGKTMFTRRGDGSLPELWRFGDQEDEVAAIVQALAGDVPETAILYRTNAQSRAFETALLRAGILYRIVGTTRFYEREEIKDSLCLLRFIANYKDEVSFTRIINKPPRGLGDVSRKKITELSYRAEGDLLKAAEWAIPNLSKKAAHALADFVKLCERMRLRLESGLENLGKFVEECLEESGLLSYHHEQDEVAGSQKEQNLSELVNAAVVFDASMSGLASFLETAELDAQVRNEDTSAARVTLITMHNTKGLEFERVIISGMEEGIFPRRDEVGEDLEEQRRLLYVALTRARSSLILTYTQQKRVFGRQEDYLPSRFLSEMPGELYLVRDGLGYVKRPTRPAAGMYQGPRDEWSGYDSSSSDAFSDEEVVQSTWTPGLSVHHAAYGQGHVVQSGFKGRSEFVVVEFEDGRRLKFLPAYSPLQRMDT